MDEPTEGLDTAGAAVFYDYLNDCIEAQKTVVVFSHDPAIIKGAGTLINLDNYQITAKIGQIIGKGFRWGCHVIFICFSLASF